MCRTDDAIKRKASTKTRQLMSLRSRHDLQHTNEKVLEEGLKLAHDKSVAKGVKFLINNGYLANTPHDIASFLRLHGDELGAMRWIARACVWSIVM